MKRTYHTTRAKIFCHHHHFSSNQTQKIAWEMFNRLKVFWNARRKSVIIHSAIVSPHRLMKLVHAKQFVVFTLDMINMKFSLYETMIHSELYFVGSMSNLFGEKRIQEDGRAKVIFFRHFLVHFCCKLFLWLSWLLPIIWLFSLT